MASGSGIGKVSREEFKRQKELDAARKAGTAPAELDEQGRAINPHIPQYISKAPWYLDTGGPSLAHQRRRDKDETSSINDFYDRGTKTGPSATKYRKGACENCGALTHKKRDCLERPRKKGAKFTGKDIQADEVILQTPVGFDAKRDRWNGYDPSTHKQIYDEYEGIEEARQEAREKEIDSRMATDMATVKKVAKASTGTNAEFGSSDEEDEDEDKYADAADAVGQKLDTKTRITVRNLRIREDTAKYLLNLDPESAYYDPKTRSMREAPILDVPPEDAKFAGENFTRTSGEAPDFQQLQLFAWQANQRGNDVHIHANPTQGELLHQQFRAKKEQLQIKTKGSILSKYGGEEYLETAPSELRQGQTENYVEYSRTGQILKGHEKVKARSKYAEDVYINNHTCVWGSWYIPSTRQWGYACCHSTIHMSYCAGRVGIEAQVASSAQRLLASDPTKSGSKHANAVDDLPTNSLSEDKVSKLLSTGKDSKRKDRLATEGEEEGSKRRKFNAGVTDEEMETYRKSRIAREDPMANYQDGEGY